MKIELKLEPDAKERKVVIVTDAVDDEIQELMRRISREQSQLLAGFSEDSVKLIDQTEIIRCFASDGKVFAVTAAGEFVLRLRLYELEERLDKRCFVRISNSEIINLRKVRNFDLSYTGTIRVTMKNGDSTFVSRRYVSRIKNVLGI